MVSCFLKNKSAKVTSWKGADFSTNSDGIANYLYEKNEHIAYHMKITFKWVTHLNIKAKCKVVKLLEGT